MKLRARQALLLFEFSNIKINILFLLTLAAKADKNDSYNFIVFGSSTVIFLDIILSITQ